MFIPQDDDDAGSDEEEEDTKKSKKRKKLSKKKKAKNKAAITSNPIEEAKVRPRDLIITASADSTVKIWSLLSGECYHVRY